LGSVTFASVVVLLLDQNNPTNQKKKISPCLVPK